MNLCQPHYIEKRLGQNHIDLNGEWDFCWQDVETDDVGTLDYKYKSAIPSSVYRSLHSASILPDPYYGTNSKLYHWVDEKIWYYRRKFCLDIAGFDGNALLCFDGISYYSRIWINGYLLGEHEGMTGGPCCDVAEHLNFDGDNEIVVEIKACNFGQKEGYSFFNKYGENTQIVPWNIVRDTYTSNGDFITFGIWNEVRIELLHKLHISRPYMYTKSIENDKANLHFEVEIADGTVEELQRFFGVGDHHYDYPMAYIYGNTGAVRETSVDIEIEFYDSGNRAYYSKDKVFLTDFEHLGMNEKFWELQFYQKEIQLNSPKLWYPNGMGEAFLYDVSVKLLVNDKVLDSQEFKYGVRTFDAGYTAGNKYSTRWDKFLFEINGKNFFLKGMNWTPIDYLFDISPERYEWCLSMAKNAGIQLIRVWNGGGIQETDSFYELCDKYGIMVWQDEFIANTDSTKNYPHEVLECQIAYNLYRIRNHASLVILCGGNEFNPHTPGNAASMYVIARTIEQLAPDKIFRHATPDKGSAHIYVDMEPVWYRSQYKQLPFVGESGIASFPNYKTLKKFINITESEGIMKGLDTEEFQESFPDLLNHFSEYRPERIPSLMARNSQIIDLSETTLCEVCEASQAQVYEFYQLMIQSVQYNYPVCGGIMPWVFKRPWPTVGVQTVDGDDRPGFAYYAVQNSYRPVNVCWCQGFTVWAPEEELSLKGNVFNQNNEDLSDTKIRFTIYNPDLSVYKEYVRDYEESYDFGKVKLEKHFTDTCFLVCVDISRKDMLINRSVYFNKCTTALSDKETYQKYRTMPTPNMYFDKGPWLKPSIVNAGQAVLSAEIVREGIEGNYHFSEIVLNNESDYPAYPVTVDLTDDEKKFYLSENFFLLRPHEKTIVRITCSEGEIGEIKVRAWNSETVVL